MKLKIDVHNMLSSLEQLILHNYTFSESRRRNLCHVRHIYSVQPEKEKHNINNTLLYLGLDVQMKSSTGI